MALKKEDVLDSEILVGIPTYFEGANVGFVARQIDRGLQKYFPGVKSAIIDIDGGSLDDTKLFFINTKIPTRKVFLRIKKKKGGKGIVLREFFEIVKKSKAKYVIVLDGDLRSLTPQWIRFMINALKKYDFCFPFYSRHKYDGPIASFVVYPLFYSLLGLDIRQPNGGDYAFRADFVKVLLKKKWSKEVDNYGINIYIATNAIFNNLKICHVNVGTKLHRPRGPNLEPIFIDVVSTLFDQLLSNRSKWIKAKRVKKPDITGISGWTRPNEFEVHAELILDNAIKTYDRKKASKIFSKEVYSEVDSIFSSKEIRIDDLLWCKAVYDSLIAYKKKGIDAVRALVPIFYARFYSFIKETGHLDQKPSEKVLKKQAHVFLANRKYLKV